MEKYEIIIYWCEEDQVFVAEVPELPGCMAHGDSHETSLNNAKDALRLWIDTALECGDPVPEAKGRRLVHA
jgi:predicted RNase H-like HicB family nuclease